MDQQILDRIGRFFPLKEREASDLNTFQVKGMKFRTRAFDAEGFGNVAVMEASGMLGMMNMTTLVLNPFSVNAPLLSYDRIMAMGNDKLYLEVFDTMLEDEEGGRNSFDSSGMERVRKQNEALPSFDAGTHWYDGMYVVTPVFKGGRKKDEADFDACFESYLEAYLEAASKAPACDEKQKRAKASAYSEGLLLKGGPATDPVKAAIGEEQTAAFFRKVLFGTDM
ncbi:MAG: hypothetical protein IJM50_06690 [Lachnospiraceae bacterium]|nr:hypothetical protein [Lachnospiraceae bacterium]